MPDLSAPILQGCYLTALGVFAGVSITRYVMGIGEEKAPLLVADSAGPPLLPQPLEERLDSPYAAPAILEEVAAVPERSVATPGISTRLYQPLDLIWVGFIFLVFFGLTTAAKQAPATPGPQLDVKNVIFSIGFQFFLAGGTIGMMIFRVRPVAWLGLRWRQWPWAFLIAPATVLSVWAVLAGLHASGFTQWMQSLGGEAMQESVKVLQNSNDPLLLGLMAFAAVLVAPVCEEIIFRGYLYPVAKRFAGPWVAAFFSALVFSVAHGSIVAALPLFILALLLIFLYEKTGSLWAPIAVHFCFNGATVLIQAIVRFYKIPLDLGS